MSQGVACLATSRKCGELVTEVVDWVVDAQICVGCFDLEKTGEAHGEAVCPETIEVAILGEIIDFGNETRVARRRVG